MSNYILPEKWYVKIVGIEDDRIVTTNSKGGDKQHWGNHGSMENINNWIKKRVWIVVKEPEHIQNSYQIY